MLIVITATIRPQKDMGNLAICDEKQRLVQYIEALYTLIKSRPNAKIVFCDNSGFGTSELGSIVEEAIKNNVELEIISFQGSNQEILEHGKGFGEGEIIKYVLENSRLAKNEEYMVKITGRLIIDNITTLLNLLDTNKVYFNIPNIHRKDIYDTRMYAMPIGIFERFFIDEYRNVYDGQDYYIEKVYRDVLLTNKIVSQNFPKYPRIRGISGSIGIEYGYTEWKCKVRDILSIFNIYGKAK